MSDILVVQVETTWWLILDGSRPRFVVHYGAAVNRVLSPPRGGDPTVGMVRQLSPPLAGVIRRRWSLDHLPRLLRGPGRTNGGPRPLVRRGPQSRQGLTPRWLAARTSAHAARDCGDELSSIPSAVSPGL